MFYVLGMATLLPWNFFSTAKEYFMFKLRNTSLPEDADYTDPENLTELQITFENYLAISAMVPNVLFLFLNTACTRVISMNVRMVISCIMMILCFALTIALVKIDTDKWQFAFFLITLLTVVIVNANSAVMQGCLFGLASMFPRRYTQSLMSGQALGGIAAAVSNIVALASGGQDTVASGFGYFLAAECFLVLALVVYLFLPKTKFGKFHQQKCHSYKCDFDTLTDEVSPFLHKKPASMLIVFRRVWFYALSVFLVFAVTLTLYPGVLSGILSVDKHPDNIWTSKLFGPIMCFLMFNVSDLAGRTVAGSLQVFRKGGGIPILSFLRLVFIPLFIFCNLQPRQSLPVIFDSDIYPIVFCVLFGITNGFLGTLCMMYGPSRVHPDDAETAGSMMSFFISAGLGAGSLFSMLVIKLV